MSYKRQLIVLFFLLVSSYSFSSRAQSSVDPSECSKHQQIEQSSEIFNEKIIMMSREYENK